MYEYHNSKFCKVCGGNAAEYFGKYGGLFCPRCNISLPKWMIKKTGGNSDEQRTNNNRKTSG